MDFFNSLSTPLFISNGLPGPRKTDLLFWQGEIGDEIPGNMQWILNGGSGRTEKIIVQRKDIYEKLLQLGAKKEMLIKLGYIYPFRKENKNKFEALICTRFDRIEHCRELIEVFPKMHFHITAPTAMSAQLMDLEEYGNVSLYPGVAADILEELFENCDYYFDINHYYEVTFATYRAFLHNHLIFAFEETVHNREFVADEHIYSITEFDRMIRDVQQIMTDENYLKQHLIKQQRHALAETKETYMEVLGI